MIISRMRTLGILLPKGHPFQYRNCWTSSQEVDECLSFLSSTFFSSFSARPPTVWV